MDMIQKALLDIHSEIPDEILFKAFTGARDIGYRERGMFNIDEIITQSVIKRRVLVDSNILGGIQSIIPLDSVPYQRPTEHSYVFKIPKSRTSGKSILSVSKVSFLSQGFVIGMSGSGNFGNNQYGYGDNTAAIASAQAVMESFDKIPVIATARCSLIGENTVMIHDTFTLAPYCYLTCDLENNSNLSNLPIRAGVFFGRLCCHAVKAEIWKRLSVAMDQNEVTGGYQLGSIKEIISEYKDSNQNYNDYLTTTWQKVLFQCDDRKMGTYLKLKFSQGL